MNLTLYENGRYSLADLKGRIRTEDNHQVSDEDVLEKCVEELLALKVNRDATGLSDPQDTSEDTDAEESANGEEDPDKPVAVMEQRGNEIWVRHLVGAACLPSGLRIEILPKIRADGDDTTATVAARRALMRMWEYACSLRLREDENPGAAMQSADLPLHEWLVRRFLDQITDLLAKGLRFQYIEREDNLLAARGRLLVAQNLRANAFAPHRFYCRFEELSPDRPENRLIQSTLAKIARLSGNDENRRNAALLSDRLHEIPRSSNVTHDFSLWRDDRLMAHYREIRSTCGWILREQGPAPVSGEEQMFGRFVRMNDVFERYVAAWMAERLQGTDHELIDQISSNPDRSKRLCNIGKDGKPTAMRPDMLVYEREGKRCLAVLDAKWKSKIGSRSDVYQMYAYASHWLAEGREHGTLQPIIALVYPALANDPQTALGPMSFKFDNLPGVRGLVLRFQLPTVIEDGGGNAALWSEGLVGVSGIEADPAGYLADWEIRQ